MSTPVGLIILWGGAPATVPSGWKICDGTNGTPDLRSKVIPCAGGVDYNPSDTGGSATFDIPLHTHGIGTLAVGGQTPVHTHTATLTWSSEAPGVQLVSQTLPSNFYGGEDHNHAAENVTTGIGYIAPESAHVHALVGPLGAVAGSSGVSQMPANTAIYYIMKV